MGNVHTYAALFKTLVCSQTPFLCSHVEGHSTVFGTGLNYTALRLLGVDKEHPVCVKARAKLHELGMVPMVLVRVIYMMYLSPGGCTSIPAWGKFWLSLLNCYDWDGNNPVPPELWQVFRDFAL